MTRNTQTMTIVRAMVVNAQLSENDYDYVVAEEWFDSQSEADYWLAWQLYTRSFNPGSNKYDYRKEVY